jgi:hypothetical protein
MSAQDHNKTLVVLHSAIGAFYTLGLIASPWIIAQNFRVSRTNTQRGRRLRTCLSDRPALLVNGHSHASTQGLRPEVSAHSCAIHVLRFLAGRNLQLVVYA